MMAALAAMQIILSRFLGIQVSDTLRLSFERYPCGAGRAGWAPWPAASWALWPDTIGTMLSGYTWFRLP